MMVLRRGRSLQFAGSALDIDVTFDLEPAAASRRDRHGPWRPPIEVYEVAAGLIVRVEIAGLADGRVLVSLDRHEMEIRGERTVAPCDAPRLFHESRIRYGPFAATVHLPFPVNEGAASAEYVDGLLTVTLPRLAATKIAMSGRKPGASAPEGEQ